jgi:hypothetical protein
MIRKERMRLRIPPPPLISFSPSHHSSIPQSALLNVSPDDNLSSAGDIQNGIKKHYFKPTVTNHCDRGIM